MDNFTPIPPLPTRSQLDWQDMELNAFVHFGPNSFTNLEWGHGSEMPDVFDPAELDCDQWVRTFKETGFKGVVVTAKHHDGFCLWPSKLSTHTVAQSKWRGGQGDVMRELADSCNRHDLRLGVYTSPWDRNHPSYGTLEYNQVFAGMLEELLTRYGPMFEVWFDGASGEGPNGRKQVYDWPLFISTVRRIQPDAVIFSDAGPDVRWVGNENGDAPFTCWSMIRSGRYEPGTPLYGELGEGAASGDQWSAPECDVSIRPGWFHHSEENLKVKSGRALLNLYEVSVGRNSLLLLNVPPNSRGLISDEDVASLKEFHRLLTETYGRNLATGSTVESPTVRGQGYEAANVFLGEGRFWASEEDEVEPSITVKLASPTTFDRVMLGEPIAFGQRISSFRIDALFEGTWKLIGEGTTIGRKRIVPIEPITAEQVRVTILTSRGTPAIDRFGLFLSSFPTCS